MAFQKAKQQGQQDTTIQCKSGRCLMTMKMVKEERSKVLLGSKRPNFRPIRTVSYYFASWKKYLFQQMVQIVLARPACCQILAKPENHVRGNKVAPLTKVSYSIKKPCYFSNSNQALGNCLRVNLDIFMFSLQLRCRHILTYVFKQETVNNYIYIGT